ncbi:SRPBCC family protein [bacterium]|nr:SRPBCC family protein [bacterium]
MHPAGQVDIDGDTATLRFERTYPHPPEKVWAALTDPEQLGAWFMTKATIDGRPGGSVEMISGPAQFHWTGPILEWDPPRRYSYEWNLPPHPHVPNGEASIVTWELFPEGQGTRLKLTHQKLTTGTALGFAPGTHAFLDRLGAQLDGAALPNWMHRYEEVKHAYPAWSR